MRCVVLAVLGTVALAACTPTNDQPGGATAEPAPAVETSDVLTTRVDDSDDVEDDPVAAAVRYVASIDALMGHSPIGRSEIVRGLVAPLVVDEHVAALQAGADELADRLEVPVERLTWVEAPITATLLDRDDGTARVDVWSVSVLGAPDAGSPQQVWRTVHVGLVRSEGTWLVESASADSGPTPQPNDLALPAGFDEFEVVAGWSPVVEGAEL